MKPIDRGISLDVEGPAAPPRANGELIFEHAWQRRLFATGMALCESGTISYGELRDRLILSISEQPDAYWSAWQDALEGLLIERHGLDLAQLAERGRRFAEHPATTMPGQ